MSNNNHRAYNHARNPFLSPPGFKTYYTIGAEAAKRMPAHKTWGEVGRELRISQQRAYMAGVVALGKLLYRIAKIIKETPDL